MTSLLSHRGARCKNHPDGDSFRRLFRQKAVEHSCLKNEKKRASNRSSLPGQLLREVGMLLSEELQKLSDAVQSQTLSSVEHKTAFLRRMIIVDFDPSLSVGHIRKGPLQDDVSFTFITWDEGFPTKVMFESGTSRHF